MCLVLPGGFEGGFAVGWAGSLGEIKAESIPYLWVILTVDQSEVRFDKR